MPDEHLDIKFRILLVEDNDGDAERVKEYVDELGNDEFQLIRAADLSRGLVMMADGDDGVDFDVVLLDLHLPDSEGIDTLRAVCEAIHGDSPLVVVLTGLDDQEVTNEALKDCANEFLIKDEITPKTLLKTLRKAVQRHGRLKVNEIKNRGINSPADSADAQRIIKRANRIATAAAAGEQSRNVEVRDVVEDLATASTASEIVLADLANRLGDIVRKLDDVLGRQKEQSGRVAELTYRVRNIEKSDNQRNIDVVEIKNQIATLHDQLKPAITLVDGCGNTPPLTMRLHTLETHDRGYVKSRENQEKTVREVVVALLKYVVVAVAGFLAAAVSHYLSTQKK